jgi:streptogramin lyase
MSSRAFPAFTLSLLAAATLLSGCGTGVANTGGGTSPLAISGHLIGGNQPVTLSTVQLYEASHTGYGTQAKALLTPAVTSGDGGSFNITNLYNCDSGSDQVYLVAMGGNPGLLGDVNNPQLALMAALGPCGTLPSVSNIIVNEVTTVAAVWALAPFMTSYDHVGTSSGNAVGLVNAFGMANNLASFITGFSPGAAPAGSTIPTAEIYSLANALAGCVNSPGGGPKDGTPCGNLIDATTVGTKSPTNTIDAALAIAQHPANNAGSILALGAGSAAAFQPTLPQSPNDWTIAATFGLGDSARQTGGMAFDAAGDLWVVATDALYELSPTGSVSKSFSNMAGNAVAIDPSGNIWVAASGKTLLEMPSTLGSPATFTVTMDGGSDIQSLALDGNGNAWYSCSTCGSVYKYNPSTAANTGFVAIGVSKASSISIDPSEQVWLGAFDVNADVSVFTNAGAPVVNSPFSCGSCGDSGYVVNDNGGNAWIVGRNLTRMTGTGVATNIDGVGGLFSPSAVSIDGAGNAWVTNTQSSVQLQSGQPEQGGLSEFTNAGVAVTPSTGYVSDSLTSPQSVAVDGSGNVWLRNSGSTNVTAFVGVGAPVATPLALAVKNGTLGSGPGGGGPGGVVSGFRQ